MGLGKTLTTLALLRTLVKAAGCCKNADHGLQKIRKACVVCPASLVAQWPNEDAKFFGRVSSNVVWIPCLEKAGGSADGTVETAKAALERWRALDCRRSCAVLSISYEAFARHCESLIDADPQLDLLIMDEGHRLRGGSKAKTAYKKPVGQRIKKPVPAYRYIYIYRYIDRSNDRLTSRSMHR